MKNRVCISGGFDPIHIGHIRYIQAAAKMGELTVILNTDRWLMRKKNYVFMPFRERKEILEAITGVHKVVRAKDGDGSVCKSLEEIRPDIFCNGGDRFSDNIPEKKLCRELGIKMRFNVGGKKIQSSSSMVREGTKYLDLATK